MSKTMIKLREFSENDVESVAENANNPKVAAYVREVFPSPYTINDAKWWVSEGCRVDDSCIRAIDLDGVCIGCVSVRFLSEEYRFSGELGYWLGEPYWSKGYATRAVNLLTEHVFSNYDVRRIYAPVASPNAGSIRVLEKCGYECEGIMKKNLFMRGEIYDECIYAKHS